MNINTDQEMQCTPKCQFFCDNSSTQWEYDNDVPYLKRRVKPACFKCSYDGHVITNWYSPCPKKLEEFLIENEKEKNND